MNQHFSAPPAQTAGFTLAHQMIRVKNLEKSLEFYTHILGMTVVRRADYPNGQFTLCFLCYLAPDESIPEKDTDFKRWLATRRGVLELTHNWGTEHDPHFSYDIGNGERGGYGHIAISVPDFAAAIAFLDSQNVPFRKRPEEGRMKDIAFITDPDGYWIEIIQQ